MGSCDRRSKSAWSGGAVRRDFTVKAENVPEWPVRTVLAGSGNVEAARRGEGRADLYPPALALATLLVIEPLTGSRYFSQAQWLRDFYSWPAAARESWRQERLQSVVRHAVHQVPFYRELLGRRSSKTIQVEELPIVDKACMRSSMEAYLSDGWERMPYVSKKTGGTSGDPWQYPLDRRAWSHIYAAALQLRERAGYRYGERIVLLGSPPSLVPGGTSWKVRARHRLERKVVSTAGLEVDRATSHRRLRTAGKGEAALWYGFAGTIAAMADAMLEQPVPITAPRAIVTTSETLQPAWRQRIEEAFGVPVFDEYGCNDGGVLAQSCRRGRFHLADNVSLVEVLDGDTVCPPGVEGDVTVTNLHATVLPFLRYKVGDRAVLAADECPCGHPGSTLERISGREGDRIQLPNGSELSALAFHWVFKHTPSVRKWQVVQRDLRHVTVRLDVQERFGEDEAGLIARHFSEQCGDQVQIELTTSEEIERSPGGKHKTVVRPFQ